MPLFPSSNTVTGQSETAWASAVQQYAIQIDQTYPPSPDSAGQIVDFGKDYIAYMDAHPNANPEIVYLTFMTRASALLSVPSVIGKSIASAAATTAQTGGDLGPAAASTLYPHWLQDFLNAGGIMRIAEGVLGVILVAVAVDKLMGSNAPAVATKIAKVVK